MVSFISSFEIINVIIPDPKIFFPITATVADAAAVNSNGIKTVLVSGLSTFFTKGKLFLVAVLKVYLEILLILLFSFIQFTFS